MAGLRADAFGLDQDEAVRSTNDDASSCKLAAVRLGYWKDPYLPSLVRSAERRTPEINRGYFARVRSIDSLIQQFLSVTGGEGQIVNFGAGFDTRYWNLTHQQLTVRTFVEVDFPNVTSRKSHYIRNNDELFRRLHTDDVAVTVTADGQLHGSRYHLVAADLRKTAEVEARLAECRLDWNAPTLLLFECVLVYVAAGGASALLRGLAQRFSTAFCVNYEQVNMGDRFGQVMLHNLKQRGCQLAGVEACTSLATQQQRLLEAGWTGARAWEMTAVYRSLPASEVQRIERIEFLDETELLDQLLDHYCICVGWNDRRGLGLASIGFNS